MIELEWILTGLFVILFASQVIVPAARNRPLFPAFHKKSWEERQLAQAKKHKEEAQKMLEAERVRAEAHKIEAEADAVKDSVIESITKEKI